MKYTIEGFSQAFAVTLKKEVNVNGKTVVRKIDCTDLVILRWFVDFYPNMKKMECDGQQYAWLTHKKLLEDLPLIDISRRAFIERMQKLVDFEVLTYKLIKDGGTFSLYGFGANYNKLIASRGDVQTNMGGMFESTQGMCSNEHGVCVQTDNKDKSIINSSNINSSNKDKYNAILARLNEKAGTAYRATSKATQSHINARLADGFTLDDFYSVIDKKCAEWKGTDMEKYLRPETLFGSKFENYLNAPVTKRGASGIAVTKRDSELDDIF